jgi:squalene-hopene/tetraprenyl-beta-curcumene cyclase
MRYALFTFLFVFTAFYTQLNAEEKAPTANDIKVAKKKAIQFLLKKQNPKGGYFGAFPSVGFTALAINGLNAANPKVFTSKHPAIKKAIDFILSKQQKNGSIADPNQGYVNYKTSVAVWALANVDKKKYAVQIKKAMAYTLLLQADEGEGFTKKKSLHFGGTGYGGELKPDLSNTQFAAELMEKAGLSKEHSFWKKTLVFIGRCQNLTAGNDLAQKNKTELSALVKKRKYKVGNDGGFAYGPMSSKAAKSSWKNKDGTITAPSYGSMSYAGLKTMLYAGLKKDDIRVQAVMQYIARNWTLDRNPGLSVKRGDGLGQQGLYYYYTTLAKALLAYGEKTLTDGKGVKHNWSTELLAKLLKAQKKDGSWTNAQSRWEEAFPTIVTSYALMAIRDCEKAQKLK